MGDNTVVHYAYQLLFFLIFLSTKPINALHKKTAHSNTSYQSHQPISLQDLAQTPYYTKISDAYQATFVDFPEQFVINLPNATLLGNVGMVITPDDRTFYDYVHEAQSNFPDWKVELLKRTLTLGFPNEPELFSGTIAVIAEPNDHDYYQWMLEALPRLKTLQTSGFPYDKIFVGPQNQSFKMETLKQFGITNKQIIWGKYKGSVQADNIIIPSMPHLTPNTRPTWACDFTRSLFIDEAAQQLIQPRKKLYIAQRAVLTHGTKNVIINEAEIEAYLAPKGFESVLLGGLSVKEQATLFNSAEVIVCAHSGALTNLIFCNSQLPVTVIELYPPNKFNRCYTTLTEQLNADLDFTFNHLCLRTNAELLSHEDKAAQHISIQLSELEEALATSKKIFRKPITLKEISQTPHYKKMINSYKTRFNPNPILQKNLPVQDESDQKVIAFPDQFIITIPHGEILGNEGMAIVGGNRPFYDYLHQIGRDLDWKVFHAKQSLRASHTNEPDIFEGTIALIASPGAHSYYHWMLDIMPRLKTLQMCGIPFDKVFVGGPHEKFKKETLEQLGLTHDQILYGDKTTTIKANNLIIPSMPNLFALKRPSWACDFMRSLFIDDSIVERSLPRKKLFITRKASSLAYSKRILINEKEIAGYLEQEGFETVTLEDLTIKEQAQLFYAADTIVAAHGAAMTNVIFCNPDHPIKVIEIYHPEHINECYTSLTQQLNNDRAFNFTHLCYVTSTDNLSEHDKEVKNIFISLNEIKKLLK